MYTKFLTGAVRLGGRGLGQTRPDNSGLRARAQRQPRPTCLDAGSSHLWLHHSLGGALHPQMGGLHPSFVLPPQITTLGPGGVQTVVGSALKVMYPGKWSKREAGSGPRGTRIPGSQVVGALFSREYRFWVGTPPWPRSVGSATAGGGPGRVTVKHGTFLPRRQCSSLGM